MCSLTVTNYLSDQLEGLGRKTTDFIERRLTGLAWPADETNPGLLDHEGTSFRSGFAADLRRAGVRKQQTGRHRVYFIGRHTDCNYSAFFIKPNKQGDDATEDDNNPSFHSVVRNALANRVVARVLRSPDEENLATEETPDWQNADWYKKYGK